VKPPAAETALVAIPIYNEGTRLHTLLDALARRPPGIDVLFVDDASSDSTPAQIRAAGFEVMAHPRRLGCGPSVRTGMLEGVRRGYEVLAVMAGNGKDDPALLGRVIDPIARGEADFVQGSRYLPGGGHANMPRHRRVGTVAYSLLFSLLAGQRITDGTNGFRALRHTILEDPRIDLHQAWLRDYEVESYLFFQAIRLGYRVCEAAVTKLYPPSGPYTKMRPFAGWWSHFRPALLLALHLKK
jgi:dolichol-phosphate mannosyltransferase